MASVLSVEDRAKIAARYEVWRSVVQVQRWWRQERGRNATLNPKTIKNCHKKLMTTGSVKDASRSGRPSTSKSEDDVNVVKHMFERSPSKSTRKAARESGLSRHKVMTILKSELHFRPWKPHYVHELFDEDCDRRMEFCEIMLGWGADYPDLYDNILWSDEAVFHVGGFVNRHNCHYWSEFDPNVTVEKMRSRPKVTVWCGMTSTRFIGPYVLRDTMNGERYLEMLRTYVWPVIQEWENGRELLFMQDGAPPHFAIPVRAWLDDNFPGRWIGRRGPTEWPARSPDLTPCDFFLWGWAKEQVYKLKPRDLNSLEHNIREVFANVPVWMLRRAVESVPKRFRQCVENAGAYVEM